MTYNFDTWDLVFCILTNVAIFVGVGWITSDFNVTALFLTGMLSFLISSFLFLQKT